MSNSDCPVCRTADIVCGKWTLLIVRDLHLGLHRFDDIAENLGISRNLLTRRLETLIGDGIVERRAYQDRPPRHEYHLTAAGRDLDLPVGGDELPLADGLAVRAAAGLAVVEVPQDLVRVEAVERVVDRAPEGRVAAALVAGRAGVAGVLAGVALVLWIAVQLLLLQRYFFLQPVIAGVGLLEVPLASAWLRRSPAGSSGTVG